METLIRPRSPCRGCGVGLSSVGPAFVDKAKRRPRNSAAASPNWSGVALAWSFPQNCSSRWLAAATIALPFCVRLTSPERLWLVFSTISTHPSLLSRLTVICTFCREVMTRCAICGTVLDPPTDRVCITSQTRGGRPSGRWITVLLFLIWMAKPLTSASKDSIAPFVSLPPLDESLIIDDIMAITCHIGNDLSIAYLLEAVIRAQVAEHGLKTTATLEQPPVCGLLARGGACCGLTS
jgi:hypothetical protein